jgi:3-oxoacyl-[acyl-carrier protein] reductase
VSSPTASAVSGAADPFDLTGKVALVTGAARGIGRSIAETLAQRGADVVVVDVLDPADTVAALSTAYPSARFGGQVVDVRERSQVETVVAGTVERFGSLDVLVNNAGTASRTGLPDFTDEEWFRDIDTNLRGTFLFCQSAIHPWMERQGSGTIINISSISGIMGGPRSGGDGGGRSGPAYAASKGGIIALTKWLAKEVGGLGITVNSVAPGPVATPMTGTVEYDFSQQILPRMGRPEEIGAAVTYLASPGAGYVTGQVLRVCGGAALG